MKYTYEALFEKGEGDGWWCVTFPDLPFIFTQGKGRDEALFEAADALEFGLVNCQLDGDTIPKPTFGHKAENGFVEKITVEPRPASEVIEFVSTAEAARMLGVTASRIRQLVLMRRLRAKKHGRDLAVRYIDIERLQNQPRPVGRPRKVEQPVSPVVTA